MAKNGKIEHEGVVKNVTAETVEVVILSQSACAGCHARSACGMADTKQKTITTTRPSFPVKSGDKVKITAGIGNAVYSVILAYVLPVILIIALIIILLKIGTGETAAATGALTGLIIYFVLLYFNRDRIGKKIKFTIEPLASEP